MEIDYSKELLNLINKYVSSQNGSNIHEKIKNYLKFPNTDEPKKEIFEAIEYIIEENKDTIINDDLLGFKNTFIKIFVDLLNKEDYKEGELEDILLSSRIDQKIRKRKKITSLLCFLSEYIPRYKILFFMLNRQKFQEFKNLFKKHFKFPFDNWSAFNEKIEKTDEESINNLYNSEQLSKENIVVFFDNYCDFLKYIEGSPSSNPSDKNEISKKRKKKKSKTKK